jgi:hypothetical protein
MAIQQKISKNQFSDKVMEFLKIGDAGLTYEYKFGKCTITIKTQTNSLESTSVINNPTIQIKIQSDWVTITVNNNQVIIHGDRNGNQTQITSESKHAIKISFIYNRVDIYLDVD